MKNILTALLVLAVLVLVVGVASHTARVDVSYVAGTWHRASLLAVAAVVAALLLVVGVLSAVAAELGTGRERQALEEELQRTYVRLRAAEARAGRGGHPGGRRGRVPGHTGLPIHDRGCTTGSRGFRRRRRRRAATGRRARPDRASASVCRRL